MTTSQFAESGQIEAQTVGLGDKAIQLIAAETGFEMKELGDDTVFTDMGFNSMTALVIADKFRTQLGVTVGLNIFSTCHTVGDLKCWMNGQKK